MTMRIVTTSYNFKITTSERIMYVFGTIMFRTDEGTLIDLWCPEETCLSQRITVAHENIAEAVKTVLRESLEGLCVSDKPFSIEALQ